MKEAKREIKKFLETNDNENMTTQNLQDAAKAVLREKFIAIQSYLKKQGKNLIDNLTLQLKQLKKKNKKKISKRKEVKYQRNKEKRKETTVKINKSWFFEKIKLRNL